MVELNFLFYGTKLVLILEILDKFFCLCYE